MTLEVKDESLDVSLLAVGARLKPSGGFDGSRGGVDNQREGEEESQEAEETSEVKGLHGASVGVERV